MLVNLWNLYLKMKRKSLIRNCDLFRWKSSNYFLCSFFPIFSFCHRALFNILIGYPEKRHSHEKEKHFPISKDYFIWLLLTIVWETEKGKNIFQYEKKRTIWTMFIVVS